MELIENLLNILKEHSVSLGTSLVLVTIVGAHIFEERIKNFRRFFNLEWFRTGREDFPTTKLKAIIIDQVGLFLSLSLFALLGITGLFFICIVVGFIMADLIQHAVFSIGRRKYTPGVVTSALYFIYVIYFLTRFELQGLHLVGMVLGAAGLAINYALAYRKVRKWRQREKLEPVTA